MEKAFWWDGNLFLLNRVLKVSEVRDIGIEKQCYTGTNVCDLGLSLR